MDDRVSGLGGIFPMLSLVAIGGVSSVLPEMHQQLVTVHGWMTDREFAQLFALSQASPGPNVLVASLMGFRVAGVPGLLVATLAMCGPSCVLAYVLSRGRGRVAHAAWPRKVQKGLVPITIGLIFASGTALARSADHAVAQVGITAAVALAVLFTDVNPIWLLGGAAVVG